MDVLELARDLIRRPSVTPDDSGCQALIAERLAQAGFAIEHLPFGAVANLWARHGNGSPMLCFAGHTDVVPPGPAAEWRVEPFAGDIVDGRLIARGAADMKGSLAAMVTAAVRYVNEHPRHPGSLAFLITSDEEGAADDGTRRVMAELHERGVTLDYCVVGEPSSAEQLGDTIRVGRRGSLSGIMTLRGMQGHVAYPLETVNPMHALAKFVCAMTKQPLDAGNERFPPTSFQMVNVHCDAGAPNVVPGELRCRFNFRYSTEWTYAGLQEHTERILDGLGLDYELKWKVAGEPFLTPDGPLIAATQAAIEETTGLVAALSTSGGTSDGRFIAPYGTAVVEVGPLNKTIHKINEELRLEDLVALEHIYLGIARRLLVA